MLGVYFGAMKKVSRRKAVKKIVGASVSLAAAGLSLAQTRSQPPNFVFFLTDDQRQDALSCYGNKILQTPNMDRIANEGVRFADMFVTNALCRPARTSILTGQYSHTHGVLHNSDGRNLPGRAGLLPNQVTFPHLLQKAGYWNVVVGKWHLVNEPGGFAHSAIFPGQGQYQDPVLIVNGARMKFRGHSCDVVGDNALQFLADRPKDKPFCLLVHFKAPHRQWIPAPRYADRFKDVTIPEPRTFDDTLQGKPLAVRQAAMGVGAMEDFDNRGCPVTLAPAAKKKCNLQEMVKNYYRVLLSVDENVGRVLDYLDKEKLAENTAVFYNADNGFFLGDHGLMDKRLMYEESIRVPLMIRYPRRVAKGVVDRQHMALHTDLAPTMLELAGVSVPGDMQGRSLVPLLEGKSPDWRNSFLYEYYEYPGVHCARKNRGVRTRDWKYIHYWELPEEYELYNVKEDPNELRNVAGDPRYAAKLTEMRAELARLRKESADYDLPNTDPGPCEFGIGRAADPRPWER